ncbi:MAG: ComEC/Rec2 family competence protein, partial [bacterium]|nr:ComEC/Rec2 family competence protein [bacterium]
YWLCLAFLTGILINSFVDLPCILVWVFFVLGIGLLCIGIFKNKRFLIFACIFLGLNLGSFCYLHEADKIFQSELRRFNDTREEVSLVGVINDEPDIKINSQQLRIMASQINGQNISERLLAVVPKYPQYRYGDEIKLTGILKTPENFGSFNYQGYLQKERVFSTIIFPQIELLSSGKGDAVKGALLGLKSNFSLAWRRVLPWPQLGIFEALVFGQEENISYTWKEKLNFAGVRHITAVSGMNITIISVLLLDFLIRIGFRRQWASAISLALIWLYIIMIGAPASGLRAGLMASLFLLAQFSGRLSASPRILVFAAMILLLENPLLLGLDAGFQLSFLAMVGLIFWQPFFRDHVFAKFPDFTRFNLSATFAAQVFTLPLLIYSFGYISLVSPLTNLLLVPIIPNLTLGGFVLGFLGVALPFLLRPFSWIMWFGLTYLVWIVDLSLKIPWSHVVFGEVSPWLIVPVYALIVYFTWLVHRRKRFSFLTF